MSIQFPNVPALPGVPSLARLQTAAQVAAGGSPAGLNTALAQALNLPAGTVFGTSSIYSGLGLQPPSSYSLAAFGVVPAPLPKYGILDSNSSPVITPDAVLELDVSADSSINTHPIEAGQFEAYNRIQQPVSIRLMLCCQGKKMSYSKFISTLKSLREGTQLVTISLPADSYDNMALKAFGYRRSSERGMVTIWADTQWMEERSNNVVVTTTPTTQPQGASTTNVGAVSAAAPTAQQQAQIANPIPLPVQLPQFTTQGINQSLGGIGNGGMPSSGFAW